MDAIRIQNLRCLADTGLVELKPITILLGQNSSGKSTFLRVLPLLRQTAEARTRGPLLWFGRLVDFGGFGDAVFSGADPKEIVLSLRTRLMTEPGDYWPGFLEASAYHHNVWRGPGMALPAHLDVHIATEPTQGAVFTRRIGVELAGHAVSLSLSAEGRLEAITVNGRDLTGSFAEGAPYLSGMLVPFLRPRPNPGAAVTLGDSGRTRRRSGVTDVHNQLAEALRPTMHGNTSMATLLSRAAALVPGTSKEILAQLRQGRQSRHGIRTDRVGQWTEESPDFLEIRDRVMALHLPSLLYALGGNMAASFRGIRYIEPLRATADRYYRFQDLAIDEIDSRGQNLPVFIHSLHHTLLSSFQDWTRRHFGFQVKPDRHAGHLSLQVNEARERSHNLADSGFGYSQILPIATQLWWQAGAARSMHGYPELKASDAGFLAVEQPELHLHPRLQAQVADAFAAAVAYAAEHKATLRIVAETHSEAIVNRIGELIAGKQLESKNVNVVLFERDSPDAPSRVRCVSYDEKGYLNDWPYGFFSASRR